MIKKKSHFFVAFLALPVYEKVTGKQRVCVHNPQKGHCIHFCLGVPDIFIFNQ
ncbi:hypothetical protein [Lactococcus lactis]|uniref:hypothetical protein n=1 Tax=Lactococcus lactis TaxID=1358 RepID=UPI00166FE2C1|nr:hypothetical protein [Lactococcus lactis]